METRTYEDPIFPAGLKSVDPLVVVTGRKLPTGRVCFDVTGENLDEKLAKLYSDFPVPWLTFVKELKCLRSLIFSLKSNGGVK